MYIFLTPYKYSIGIEEMDGWRIDRQHFPGILDGGVYVIIVMELEVTLESTLGIDTHIIIT